MNIKTFIKSDFVVVVIVVLVTLALIGIGAPVLRDFLVAILDPQAQKWLTANRITLVSWIDWSRIVFEVTLALFISNQVFNDRLRELFEKSLERLKVSLTSTLEESIKRDDARIRIKKALNEIIAFLYLPGDLWALPTDIPVLFKASWTISREVRWGIPDLFVRLLALRVLGAFSGKLHATAALFAFWGVLLMKVLKLYLDAPAFIHSAAQ